MQTLNIQTSEEVLAICAHIATGSLQSDIHETFNNVDSNLPILEVLRQLGYAKLIIDEYGNLSYFQSPELPIIVLNEGASFDDAIITESRTALTSLISNGGLFSDYELDLAEKYYDSGQIEESLLTIKILDKLKNDLSLKMNLARYYRLKGLEAFYSGQTQLLPRYFRKAIQEAIALDDHLCLANSYTGLANFHAWVGELGVAIENYGMALSEYGEIDDKRGEAKVKLNIGLAFMKTGRISEATNSIEDAIHLLSNLKNDFLLQYAFLYKALIMKAVDKFEEASEDFQTALELSPSTGNSVVYHLSKIGIVSTSILRKTGKYDIQSLDNAKEYFSQFNDVNHNAAVYAAFCEYNLAKKDEAGFDLALNNLLSVNDETPLQQRNEMIAHLTEIFKAMKILKSSHITMERARRKVIEYLRSPDSIKEFDSNTEIFMGCT